MINHLLEHAPGQIGKTLQDFVEARLADQIQSARFNSGCLFEGVIAKEQSLQFSVHSGNTSDNSFSA